jgi:hypothetical protein
MKSSKSIFGLLKAFCLGAMIQGLGVILTAPVLAQSTPPKPTIPSPPEPPPVQNPGAMASPTPISSGTTTPPVTTQNLGVVSSPTPTASETSNTPPATPTAGATASAIPIKIITPTMGAILDVPAATLIVQYRIGTKIELKVNGVLVDSSLIGRTETDSKNGTITQTWYGVSLNPGENQIVAHNSNGETDAVKIAVRGVPTKIQISTLESRVPSDGRSLVNIVGQLLDENGNNSKRDTIITLYTSAGEFAGVDADRDQPGFQVKVQQGQFKAQLRSSLDAQTVRIRATAIGIEANTQVQFETNLRNSIATGLIDLRLGARGTDYYRPYSEFLPVDRDNSTQLQARGQAFGTGRIGNWLVTGAFNSDRPLNKVCNTGDRLFRDTNNVQSCDEVYPVYGDSSKVDVTTPSRDSVFIKLENSIGVTGNTPNMVMWGDYGTTEFTNRSQQLTGTNRNLHGAKFNYNINNLLLSGFYGDNVQGFQRDSIAPDGTSGYYFLSQRLVLGGSELLTIETEELERPGTVLKVETLSRGLDYEFDYDRGTILLRRPLLRTAVGDNGNILVRRLVATYQYANGSNNSIFGSRAQYNINRETGRESWLGASWIRENQGVRDFTIIGADALFSLGPNSNIAAEFARSSNNTGTGSAIEGNALRLEGQFKLSDTFSGRAHYRNTETGFANNATTSFVPGQTRYGSDLTARLGDNTNLRFQYDREENRGTPPQVLTNPFQLLTPVNPLTGMVDNDLTTISAGIQQRFANNVTIDLDYINRNRQDRLALDPTQANVASDQIRSRLAVPLGNNLTLRAQNEINLSNQQDVVYPNRTALGVEWAVYPGVNLRLSQNYISSTQFGDTNYTSLDFDSSYNLTSNTKVTGRYSLSPYQSIGSVGLQQGFILSPGLKLDLNYERIIGGIASSNGGQQFPQPYSIGQSGSTLGTSGGDSYGIGLNYTDNPNFQANARYEYRDTGVLNSTSINAGITGKLTPELTALARYQQSSATNQVIRDAGLGDTINFKIGLALRNPAIDQWNGLLSYQYRRNPSLLPASILTSTGTGSEDHTLSLEAIYAPNWQWEFGGKYALRNATSYLDSTLSAGSTIGLSQFRATYRLGYAWDITGDVRWLNQYASGRNELGAALEGGYYLSPNLRLSAGYSLGVSDDPSGRRSADGPYLGLTLKLNDLFGGFGRQDVAPTQQQESKIR